MNTLLRDQFTPEQRATLKPKIVQRNTFRFQDGKATVTRLHSTDIVRALPRGRYILNSGGWRTPTTKERMNGALVGYHISQSGGQWYVHGGEAGPVPYFDGMELPRHTKPTKKAERLAQRELKLRGQIKRFCNRLNGLQTLPEPQAGDCFICMMANGTHKEGPGRMETDRTHLMSHIQEGYIHGSLLMNALRWAGYGNPQVVFQMEQADRQNGRKLWNGGNVKRALKRYLYAQLGLVR